MPAKSSMDGRLRSTFGCPSVRKLPYVYEELETPSTLCTPTSSSFVSPCGLGDNSERCSSLPERKAHEGEHKFTESCRHQHSASKRNRQRHLCMQDILCRSRRLSLCFGQPNPKQIRLGGKDICPKEWCIRLLNRRNCPLRV